MKKYELKENTIQVKAAEEIFEGCTLNQDWQYPVIIKAFDSKEDALNALKEYKSAKALRGGKVWEVTEYYVEENEYNQDGEFIDGGDVLKFAEFEDDEEELPGF